jgi:hypothetical protein
LLVLKYKKETVQLFSLVLKYKKETVGFVSIKIQKETVVFVSIKIQKETVGFVSIVNTVNIFKNDTKINTFIPSTINNKEIKKNTFSKRRE